MASDRHEFPKEWILSQGGDPNKDDDYTFVGNCGVYYRNPDTEELYHVGVTAFGEVAGSWSPGGPGSIIYAEAKALDIDEIPRAAINVLAEEGLRQIGSLSGNLVLSALGVDLPSDLEPFNFARLLNGSDEEKGAEHEKQKQWKQVGDELRQELII